MTHSARVLAWAMGWGWSGVPARFALAAGAAEHHLAALTRLRLCALLRQRAARGPTWGEGANHVQLSAAPSRRATYTICHIAILVLASTSCDVPPTCLQHVFGRTAPSCMGRASASPASWPATGGYIAMIVSRVGVWERNGVLPPNWRTRLFIARGVVRRLRQETSIVQAGSRVGFGVPLGPASTCADGIAIVCCEGCAPEPHLSIVGVLRARRPRLPVCGSSTISLRQALADASLWTDMHAHTFSRRHGA